MKKILVIIIMIIIAGFATNCKKHSNKNIFMYALGYQSIMPKIGYSNKSTAFNFSNFFIQSVYADDYDISWYIPMITVPASCASGDIVCQEDWDREFNNLYNKTISKMSLPMLTGFTYGTYEDGTEYYEKFFSIDMKTNVRIYEDRIEFIGRSYSELGTHYALKIYNNNIWTFEQYISIPFGFMNPDGATQTSSTPYKKVYFFAYSNLSGTLDGLNADGSGFTHFIEVPIVNSSPTQWWTGDSSFTDVRGKKFYFDFKVRENFLGMKDNSGTGYIYNNNIQKLSYDPSDSSYDETSEWSMGKYFPEFTMPSAYCGGGYQRSWGIVNRTYCDDYIQDFCDGDSDGDKAQPFSAFLRTWNTPTDKPTPVTTLNWVNMGEEYLYYSKDNQWYSSTDSVEIDNIWNSN